MLTLMSLIRQSTTLTWRLLASERPVSGLCRRLPQACSRQHSPPRSGRTCRKDLWRMGPRAGRQACAA